jgi:hypothetical protein
MVKRRLIMFIIFGVSGLSQTYLTAWAMVLLPLGRLVPSAFPLSCLWTIPDGTVRTRNGEVRCWRALGRAHVEIWTPLDCDQRLFSDGNAGTVTIEAAGFPVNAVARHSWYLLGAFSDRESEAADRRGGIRGGLRISLRGEDRYLPVLPCFPGIIINSLTWGLGSYMVWRLWVWTRRGSPSQGQCVQCGYPVDAGDRCPECGARDNTHRADEERS